MRDNGGWHLSYYMSAPEIARKLSSFSHSELDTDQYKNAEHLQKCLLEGKDLFNRGSYFDMRPASIDRMAAYPEGWKEIAKKLADMQKLPSML